MRENQQKPTAKQQVITLLVLFIVLFLLFKGCKSCSAEAPLTAEDTARQAYGVSKYHVRANLKSPSTAEFELDGFSYKIIAGNVFIYGHVDSQNSFGAMIRTNYVFVTRWNGKDWDDLNNWEVISLTFQKL